METYKDQLGVLIQIGLFAATIVLIRVGGKQARAADAQARAAEAQVVAANQQAEAAKTQLNLTVKQMYAALSGMDAASRPLLHIGTIRPDSPDCIDDDELMYLPDVWCEIANQGLGPALEMEAYYGDNPSEAAGMFGDYMGVGEKRTVTFELMLIKKDGLTIRYKSTHGSIYETRLHINRDDESIKFHRLVKNAFQELGNL